MPKRSTSKKRGGFKEYYRQIIFLAIAIVLLCVGLFMHFVYDNPNNVFNGMISNSLYTPGFLTTVSKNNQGQTSTEYIVAQTGATNITDAVDKINVPGKTHYEITSESIGTPYDDYARYLSINSNATDSHGKPINYRSIIGVWGVSATSSTLTEGQLFNTTVLGVVPIGLLSQAQHSQLISQIKTNHVYTVLGSVKHQYSAGRLQYVYNIKVNSKAYVNMLKTFGTDLGLNQLGGINSGSLPTIPELSFTVDVLSRQLVAINSKSSGTQETFGSYGVRLPIKAPTQVVPLQTLETRLESL